MFKKGDKVDVTWNSHQWLGTVVEPNEEDSIVRISSKIGTYGIKVPNNEIQYALNPNDNERVHDTFYI